MLTGSIVALVTPFNEENEVDYPALERLLYYHLENQTDGIVVLGTTAEAESLSDEEKKQIVDFVCRHVGGKIKIMVGILSNVTEKVIAMSRLFEGMEIDSYLVITPYYNKSNTKGLLRHFTQIADACDHPIVVYHVPKRTGLVMDEETVRFLSYHPNIIGIKEASGNLAFQAQVAAFCNENFVLYGGDDLTMLASMALGAKGIISVIGNAFPKELKLIVDSFSKNIEISRSTYFGILSVTQAIYLEVSPILIKYLLYLMGFMLQNVRLPLAEGTLRSKHAVKTTYLTMLES
ncbi:MAG TPA: 4-hydroxy-tetrahydrodipicolinate synthase [Candidatus Pelethenecus faecipullorum]|uniref:4-hydroxy-tetrahydrodipicolinate synthase n=1 Tax=Candidatus Pelethenecus faecipullorum TaxID=2840900 RepID=A0A9D1KK07_9MOLU|nr:4-hydroxy-tetrahydrodipicolinate synthase [Candidatus Pelethenecus faecipullorum]